MTEYEFLLDIQNDLAEAIRWAAKNDSGFLENQTLSDINTKIEERLSKLRKEE